MGFACDRMNESDKIFDRHSVYSPLKNDLVVKIFCIFYSFRNMFVAGEHCDRETMEWTKNAFDCPVLDNWWQTGI